MIKVEFSKSIEDVKSGIQGREHIWLKGQPWPVLEADDSRIVRVEAFGEELGECLTFASNTGKPINDSHGKEVCRTWYATDAQNVSKAMRQRNP